MTVGSGLGRRILGLLLAHRIVGRVSGTTDKGWLERMMKLLIASSLDEMTRATAIPLTRGSPLEMRGLSPPRDSRRRLDVRAAAD
jgi:hypothetical protein